MSGIDISVPMPFHAQIDETFSAGLNLPGRWHKRPRWECCMTPSHPIVFLVDVDNTLVDNDGIQQDLKDHLERTYGLAARERYWRILEDLFVELSYRDYIGALQRFRVEHPREVELLSMSSFLMDYPFADRLYPGALEVLKRLRAVGPTVILSDGDVVFQPRKVEHAGIADAVDGHVLIYIHKEEALDDVERRYPAEHYVFVDDKLRILDAVKQIWGERVTTVFPRQGQYAHDAKLLSALPPADVTIERIGDLLHYDLPRLRTAPHVLVSNPKVTG
jgi:FMN phosphatase YigB (HAD superfamily)